jgi:hypothetical protein
MTRMEKLSERVTGCVRISRPFSLPSLCILFDLHANVPISPFEHLNQLILLFQF